MRTEEVELPEFAYTDEDYFFPWTDNLRSLKPDAELKHRLCQLKEALAKVVKTETTYAEYRQVSIEECSEWKARALAAEGEEADHISPVVHELIEAKKKIADLESRLATAENGLAAMTEENTQWVKHHGSKYCQMDDLIATAKAEGVREGREKGLMEAADVVLRIDYAIKSADTYEVELASVFKAQRAILSLIPKDGEDQGGRVGD